MTLKQCIFTENRCYKKGQRITGKPIGIVVHSTGANNKTLRRYVQPVSSTPDREDILADLGKNTYGNHWNRSAASACVHAFIGVNSAGKVETYQVLPFELCCWGCGKGKKGSYNYNPTAHIQFEICEDKLTDATYFDQAFGEAIEFCAHLCRSYGLRVDQIVSHKEASARGYASAHGDPEHWLKKQGRDMDWFRDEVAKRLNAGASSASSAPAFEPYRVRVTATALNYRAGAGTGYKINGVVHKGEVYTIVEEKLNGSTKWGRLKSGAGWISLKYTKKM